MKEIWKDIKDYEGLYQVSSYGQIKSFGNKSNHKKEKILKTDFKSERYARVNLLKMGKQKYYLVHRLVALTFLKNDNNYSQVNHINGNKKDNRIINLEWVTAKENSRHAYKNNLINKEKRTKLSKIAIKKAQKIATELKKKEIIQKDLNNKTLNKFPSIKEANIQTNIDCSSIIRCAKGKQSQAGGYKWEYQI